jgi:glycosyltransferase involved in cell wall biosynthesis
MTTKDRLRSLLLVRGPQPAGPAQAARALTEAADTPQVVDRAVAEFGRRYPDLQMPPVVVVIAALREQDSVGDVIDEIPDEIAGLACRVLIVDDGSEDRTSEVAAEHGALVCRLERNCGQGTAFRAGYRLVAEGGGRYIATMDADGQWDPADLPAMVELLEAGKADLVLGSRRLGRTENTNKVRNVGVRVFSVLISAITRTRITDSSSGLRAMRVEVATTVRQTQPQYQSSELLIGAIFQRFKVAEVPTVMRLRTSGESRKGRNFGYGAKYALVIARTSWREWRGRPRRRRGR